MSRIKKETDELNNIPFTVPLQEKGLQEGAAIADAKSRQVIRHSIKTGHGHGAGGGGGAAVANSGESTTTPATQGGAAMIPVYAAGAANNNHHPSVHHSVASRNQESLGPLNLCASVMAILVLRVHLVCEFEK